jgi:cytoskeleton protein RodZ
MPSIGQKLRERRVSQGLTLGEVSIRTKIRESYLQAIEEDQLDAIPGGFFSRAFVRQYAEAIGLGAKAIEPDLELVTAPPADEVKVDKIFMDYRPALPGRDSLASEEEPEFLSDSSYLKQRRTGTPWIILAALLIAGSAGFLTWQQRPELFTAVFAKSAPEPAPANPPVEQAKAEEPAVPESSSASETVVEPTTPAPELASPSSTAPVSVKVTATEFSWVRLITDGRKVFGGTMDAGETRVLEGKESVVVFSGNAGGLFIVHNGKAIEPIGPRGQVRTATFTSTDVEIKSGSPTLTATAQPAAGAAAREP